MSRGAATGIEIFVFKGAKFLGSRCFSQPTVVIGRGREAALKLQDASIAERHAIVRLEGGDLVLADAGGSGVTVNGERVRVCRVSSADEVVLGPFRLKLSILGEQEEDQGFSSETGQHDALPEEDRDTFIERVDAVLDAERDDATLPKLQRPQPGDLQGMDFDDAVTHAQPSTIRRTGSRPVFSARERLGEARRPREEFALHRGASEGREQGESRHRGAEGREHGEFAELATKAERPRTGASEAIDEYREDVPTSKGLASQRRARQAELDPDAMRDLDRHREREGARRASAGEEQRRARAAQPAHAAETVQELAQDDEEASQGSLDEAPAEEQLAGEYRPWPGDDDDELEEENWVEPFSLLENIVRERFKTPVNAEPFAMIEAIHYRGNQFVNLLRANPGESIEVGHEKFNLVTLQSDGRALVYFQKDFSGTLVAKGKARPLKSFCKENYLVDREAEIFAVVLQEGDYAQVLRGTTGYLLRFVRPPVLPQPQLRMGMNLASIQSFAASVACHFCIAILMGVIGNLGGGMKVESEKEMFAKISLTDVNLEKLKEETKIETKKDEPRKDEPKIDQPKDVPKPKKTITKAPKLKTNVPLTEKQKAKIQKKAVANVLSALENLKPAGPSAGRSDLKALTSNISAVRVPGGGSAANFKISGVIGKGVGDGVRLAGGIGGGGGKDTRVGSQLLAGGSKIGNLAALAGTGTKSPRARVGKAPTRSISTTGGTLSREAIQQVVNSHMAEVQACYERQLLGSPGLAGKVVFDWVIEMGGGVSSARQASSTMKNPQVAMCVLGLIRTWRFPSPVGGSVQVRYPFVFRVQGF